MKKIPLTLIFISILFVRLFSQSNENDLIHFCSKQLYSYKLSKVNTSRHEFDVKYYEIFLNWYNVLKNSNKNYEGKVTIIAQVDTSDYLNQIVLHNGLTIDSIKQNNSSLQFTTSENLVTINLDRIYNKNELFELEIYFRRTSTDNPGFYYYSIGSQTLENLAYTMSEPSDARYWFPCFDDPSDKADSSKVIVVVPKGYSVASNGLLLSQSSLGDSSIFVWFNKYPITTYLISVTASKYSLFIQSYTSIYPPNETIEVWNFQWQSDSSRSVYVMRNLPTMLNVFETYYGKYPFEKYGHAIVSPFSHGGMEHQTMTTIHRNWLTLDAQSGIAHELAHMWWGDMVTCETWKDIWLNEGFATFSEDLYREITQGKSAYFSSMNSKANYYFNYNPGYAIYNPPQLFNAVISYYKGALVLNMLRYVLGDSLFFQTLRNYRNAFLYSTATTEDLKNIVNQTAGEDLSYFFDQWIYQPNHPVYVYNWNVVQENNQYQLNFIIKQTQSHYNIYKMPIELKIIFANGDTVIKIWNDERTQSYSFTFEKQPTNLVVDPMNYILKQISRNNTLSVEEENLQLNYKLYQNFPNPFNSQTEIRFSIRKFDKVKLSIYSPLGKEIKILIDEFLNEGSYTIHFDGKELSSGIYFYKLETSSFSDVKKLVLIK